MRQILAIARLDLALVLADRGAVVWMFLLPLVFAGFFGAVLGGPSSSPQDAQARLTVVDEDGGPVAKALLTALASERLDLVELAPAEKDTTEGKVRTLVIPSGFSDRVLAGEQVAVRLEKDPDTSAEAALLAQARIVAAIGRVLGRLVEESGQGSDLAQALVQPVTDVDVVRVESSFAGRARTVPSGFAQSIPGNLVMFVMLLSLTYGAANLTAERTGGQLRRLVTTPASRTQIVLGKIVGRFVVAALQVVVLVVAAAAASQLWNLPLGDDPLALLVVLLVYALAVAPLGVLFGAWFQEADVAANLGVIATLVMAAFGGCWWPLEIVSRPLQLLALAFPTTWAMKGLHGLISFGFSLGDVVPSLLALIGFAALFTLLTSRSLRVE